MTPRVSIFCTSIRPQLWPGLYYALSATTQSFELIITSPYYSTDPPPSNVRIISTNVKPAQAIEIGRRACRGEYTMYLPDDVLMSVGALDLLCAAAEESTSELTMLTARYAMDGEVFDDSCLRYNAHDATSPLVSIGNFMKRSTAELLGGLDRNFIAHYWDLDLALRLHARGGSVRIVDTVVANELRVQDAGISLSSSFGKTDRDYLTWLWGDGKNLANRPEVFAYQDVDLLTVTQGRSK